MASTKLTRTTGTPSNTDIGTVSFWMKRSRIDENNHYIFSNYVDGSNFGYIRFKSDYEMQVFSNSLNDEKRTTRLFRDTAAWYHVVVRVDTTQGTAADRVRLYINGVQETSFDPISNGSQGADYDLFKPSGQMIIGHIHTGTATYFDGQLAHFHYTDGQSYGPDTFGETDTTTGVWKPKTNPGISTSNYGNNGFFLKFDNSGNMGLDSSGNSNNFTTSGTLIQNKDTPSNNQTTWNMLDQWYFWGAEESSNIVNTGLTVTTGGSQYSYIPANFGVDSGKWYWEVKYVSKNGGNRFPMIGITSTQSTATSHELGHNAHDWCYYTNNTTGKLRNNDSDTSFGDYYIEGDIIGVALDCTNNKLYFSKNGQWQQSGDPSAGSNGISITAPSSTPLGAYFPSVCYFDGTYRGVFSANFGNGYFGTTSITSAGLNGNGSLFEYDVPTGYYGLNTKNIGTQS